MFALRPVEQETQGSQHKMHVPLGQYLSTSFEQGEYDSVFNAVSRMEEFRLANNEDSPLLQPDTLNKRYGLPTLEFKYPEKESTARLKHFRKKEELARMYDLEQGSNGFISGRTLGMFGAAMVGAVMNPLDFSLIFVPVVGSSGAAAKIAGTGFRAGLNRAFTRSLISRESLQGLKAPQLVESVLQGAGGGALLMTPTYLASKQDQAMFTDQDFAIGIALMGALSSGIHFGVKGIEFGAKQLGPKPHPTSPVAKAINTLNELPKSTRVEMARAAINQVVSDQSVDLANFVKIDDNAIRAKIQFDEGGARYLAEDLVNDAELRQKVFDQYHASPVAAAMRDIETGEVHQGPFHWSIPEVLEKPDDYPFERGFILNDGRYISEEQLSAETGLPKEYTISERIIHEEGLTGLGPLETDFYHELMEQGKTHAEALNLARAAQRERIKEAFWQQPINQERFLKARQEALNDVVEQFRQKFDPESEFNRLRKVELENQIREGKILPQDEIEARTYDPDGSLEKLQKEVEELRKEVEPMVEKAEQEMGVLDQAIEWADKMIKELEKPSDRMFTGVVGVEPLIAMVGKEVAKGLLIALREGLRLTKDVTKAIDHAMAWFDKQSTMPEVVKGIEADRKLAQSEIKENLRKAKQEGNKEEIARWSKFLNPDMSRRGFLESLGKIAAVAGIGPSKLLPIEKEAAKKVSYFRTPLKSVSGWSNDKHLFMNLETATTQAIDDIFSEFNTGYGEFVAGALPYKDYKGEIKTDAIDTIARANLKQLVGKALHTDVSIWPDRTFDEFVEYLVEKKTAKSNMLFELLLRQEDELSELMKVTSYERDTPFNVIDYLELWSQQEALRSGHITRLGDEGKFKWPTQEEMENAGTMDAPPWNEALEADKQYNDELAALNSQYDATLNEESTSIVFDDAETVDKALSNLTKSEHDISAEFQAKLTPKSEILKVAKEFFDKVRGADQTKMDLNKQLAKESEVSRPVNDTLREILEDLLKQTKTPDFVYQIESQLDKPVPWDIAPDRFTPQTIMKRIAQLPVGEQALLKKAGIEDFLKDKIVDPEKFKEFIRSALPQIEIKPMLNVRGAGVGRKLEGTGGEYGEMNLAQTQHYLETNGFKFDAEGRIISEPVEYTSHGRWAPVVDDYRALWASKAKKEMGEGVLIDEYVSQNVSVPIHFEKMEKPRTVFLAAPQNPPVFSSHYSDVFPVAQVSRPTKVVEELVGQWGLFIKKDGKLFMAGNDRANLAARNDKEFNKNFDLRRIKPDDQWNTLTNVPDGPSMLGWAETHIVTLPDGRRALHVFEVQSDVRQDFGVEQVDDVGTDLTWMGTYLDSRGEYAMKKFTSQKEAQVFVDQKLREYQENIQPHINHTDEILLKSLVKMAQKEGLDGVIISDPRTAMLTQGHVGEMRDPNMFEPGGMARENPETTFRVETDQVAVTEAFLESHGAEIDGPTLDQILERTGREKPPTMYATYLDLNHKVNTVFGDSKDELEKLVNEKWKEYAKAGFPLPALPLEYVPPSQAAGMVQAYGNKLPNIMKKISGNEGEPVVMGPGKHYAHEFLTDYEDFSAIEKGPEYFKFDELYPGPGSPSGLFFPVKQISKNPYLMFEPRQAEYKPKIEEIDQALDIALRNL